MTNITPKIKWFVYVATAGIFAVLFANTTASVSEGQIESSSVVTQINDK